jgi:formylmethanofuran dehydrogenase subunit E
MPPGRGITALGLLMAVFLFLSAPVILAHDPPMSCLADGLQAATGASLGCGTISVEHDKSSPEALFIRGDERLRLALKDDVRARMPALAESDGAP